MSAPAERRATLLNLEAALTPYSTQVEQELKKYLAPREPKELYDAVRHLFDAGGKRLRPMLSLLSAQAVGGDSAEVLPYAGAVEMTHVFTLIHDDIMDAAEMRRGVPAVHRKFGPHAALLAGDLLQAMAFETLTRLNVPSDVLREIVRDFATLIKEICEGQEYDLRFETQKRVDELTYFHMAERKTATLYEMAMKHGALIAKGDTVHVRKLAEAGRLIGLSFQVWDDVLDLTGEQTRLGKPVKQDLFSGKKTLIVVYAMDKLDPLDRRKLIDLIAKRPKAEEDVREILRLYDKAGAIRAAQEKARAFSSHAKSALAALPPTNARTLIQEIADYAVTRDK